MKNSLDNSNKPLIFIRQVEIPHEVLDAFNYHARYRALDRMIPPWSFLKVIKRNNGLENGATCILGIQYGPLKFEWIANHFGYIKGQIFQDEMIKGPLKTWKHSHSFTPNKFNGCIVEDKIEYSLPYGLNTFNIFKNRFDKTLNQMFTYRHQILNHDLKLWTILKENRGKRILISGSTGLIGSALIPFLDTVGEHKISRLIRPSSKESARGNNSNFRVWDPKTGIVNPSDLEEFDAIIHLCGENIGGRWSKAKKKRIYDSRVRTTELLCNTIKKLKKPPSTLVCASAIGYYGSKDEQVVTEETKAGDGFLADLCADWEAEAKSVESIGVRVVNARFGLILSPKGGILKLLSLASCLRTGIEFGKGSNVFNWVSIEDVIGSILYSIGNTTIHGPINIVSPNPVKATDFTKIISKIQQNLIFLKIQHKFMKLIMGEFADTISQSNGVVKPQTLLTCGYPFMNPNLEDAVRFLLGRQIVNKTDIIPREGKI